MHDGFAHDIQIGLGAGEGVGRAAAHEGQAAGFGAADAAGNRRVDHGQARGGGRGADLARGGDIDGRTIDEQGAGIGGGQDAIVTKIDLGDMPAGRQHGDHHVNTGRRFAGAGLGLGTGLAD